MPITPNDDQKTRQHHSPSEGTVPLGAGSFNRLDDPLNATRAAGRKLCRSRKSDYLAARG